MLLRKYCLTTVFVIPLLLTACQKVVHPVQPVINSQATPEEKEIAYKQYKFSMKGHMFSGAQFYQGTNEIISTYYGFNEIGNIVKESSNSIKSYNNAVLDFWISYSFAGAGGGCIGWELAPLIFGQMNTSDQYILAGGVGAIVISYIFSSLSTFAFNDAFNVYNKTLKNKLNIEGNNPKVSFNFIPSISYDYTSHEIKYYTTVAKISF
jgi:hypothetical protein